MNLADLSKDTLIEITRIVNGGTVGDTARNAKQHYVDLLTKKDATEVEAAYAKLGPSAEGVLRYSGAPLVHSEGAPNPEAALAAALRALAPQGLKREDVEKIVAEYLAVYMTSDTTKEVLTRLVQQTVADTLKVMASYIELGIKNPEDKS